MEYASRHALLGGCRDPGVAVANAVAVAMAVAVAVAMAVAVAIAMSIILAATMAVADGSGRHLGLGRGRGFGRDCLRRTWLGAVPAAAAAAAVVLTVSAVAVAASELWLLPWPPWAGPFLVLVVCVIIIVRLSMGAWARTFAWLHACSWRWS